MRGYHGRPDATAEVLDEEGTLRTGDLGELDEDGYLWIRGRLKEQFKLRNGKFVVPAPLEEALKLSVYVDEVMVVGDNRDHTAVLVKVASDALAEWAGDHGVDSDEDLLDDPRVQELYRRELEQRSGSFKHYEVPQAFRLVDDEWSPTNGMLTPTLKLRRSVLERRYADLIEDMF
jgi:long-chain acyl-CoA synthetase